MFIQLFGKYLVDNNIVNAEIVSKARQKLSSTRAKLGMIAISQNMISEGQAAEINRLQTERDQRFGDIAIEEGYITKEQLDKLLELQGNDAVKFEQLISELAGLSIPDIEKHIKNFQKSFGFDDSELECLKKDELDTIIPIFAFSSKPYITDICSLALRNITRFVTSDFYIGKIKHVTQFDYTSLAGQKLVGDADVTIAFGAGSTGNGLIDIANGFAHENLESVNIEVYDAIGEFVNCISGLFATALSKKEVKLEILPQFAYENQSAKGEAYVLPIFIGEHEVSLYISVEKGTSLGEMPVVRKILAKDGGEVTSDSKGTIVIVDDSGMSRKMLRNILEESGYTVLAEATDGLEGVLAYKQYSPDIITLDITMPNMDGTAALKEIMAYDKNAKAIMITAAGQQNKIIEALKAGAERFVTKPFDKDEIIKNIEEMLNA